MKLATFKSWIEGSITTLLFLLVTGTPLLFTSLTRSVFEVNKLLLLRIVTLLIIGLWVIYVRVIKDNNIEEDPNPMIILGIKWKKIGLEWPMIIWIILNILSTIFSQNFYVGIIGAYDRWEGIFTIINYIVVWTIFAKWVKRPSQLKILLGGILISTSISAIYGICQSFGIDFMNWSVNASARVFACINNPVHFCAYVGMVVLILIGWLLSLPENKKASKGQKSLKILITICTALIYYAQFLSFSRATWVGFCLSAIFFFAMSLSLFATEDKKALLKDLIATSIAVASIFLIYIFKISSVSLVLFIGLSLLLLGTITYLYTTIKDWKTHLKTTITGVALLTTAWLTFNQHNAIIFLIQIAATAAFIYFLRELKVQSLKSFFAKLIIIVLFTKLQFVPSELSRILIFFPALIYSLYIVLKNPEDTQEIIERKGWLVGFALMFGFILSAPSFSGHITKLINPNSETKVIAAVQNAQKRASYYEESITGQSARYSMWKSALPWIKDYWMLGSGPDTVKYMYPDYRRTDYGKLEGGHNFTPDKLHNEYINTLATRGVIASIVYYIALIGGWYVLVINGFIKMKTNNRFILLGLIGAVTVYMGQILFNFGVVATLVLFYIFVGLGHAMVIHPELNGDNHEQ